MTVIDETGRSDASEDSVLIATDDFARRRLRARLGRWRPYLIGALVLVLVATGVWLLWFSSVVTVEEVEVSGTNTLSPARIERAAAVPMGEQLVQVDLAAIEARVERIDAVASAKVSRSWPHGISIEVTERVPIAVVRIDGTQKALAADGVAFDYKKSLLPNDIPVVETELDVTAATLSEAAAVVLSLPAAVATRVNLIKADSIDRMVLKLDGGITVQWGTAEDSDTKAQVLEALLGTGEKFIDVSVPGRPATR